MLEGDMVMTNNDWVGEILIEYTKDLMDGLNQHHFSRKKQTEIFTKAGSQILDHINKNYVSKDKVTDSFKCEYGHEVCGHKTVDGYCCACEADIAFIDKCITKEECEKRVLEAKYVNSQVLEDLITTILDSTPEELPKLYPKLEALAGHIKELSDDNNAKN